MQGIAGPACCGGMARKTKKLVVRVEAQLSDQLCEAAAARERAVGDLVRLVLRDWLRQRGADASAAVRVGR